LLRGGLPAHHEVAPWLCIRCHREHRPGGPGRQLPGQGSSVGRLDRQKRLVAGGAAGRETDIHRGRRIPMSNRTAVGSTAMAMRPRTLKGHVLFQILTKAIYTTFTRAIKEAVSNAYDAGANNVEITFDPPTFLKDQEPSQLTIQIRDDGKGMSLEDFWE